MLVEAHLSLQSVIQTEQMTFDQLIELSFKCFFIRQQFNFELEFEPFFFVKFI